MDKKEAKELEIEKETKRQEDMENSPSVKKAKDKEKKWANFEDETTIVGATDGEVLGDDL